MNEQPIEKYVKRQDGKLDVHSIFHTIQGEGPLSGTPAIFIRLAGCNLQCPLCDTDYTLDRKSLSVNDILFNVINLHEPSYLVVISGGEPFRQDIGELIDTLWSHNYGVQIETNGTLPPSDLYSCRYNTTTAPELGPMIVCSPKTGKIHLRIEGNTCAFKYIIADGKVDKDGLPSSVLGHSARPARPLLGSLVPIYIQPEDSGNAKQNKLNMQQAVKSCMEHGYTLQVQLHKIVGIE